MSRRPHPTFPCPNCGAQVRKGASACRECGSDASTGWAEDADSLGVDLPAGYRREEDDEGFDYENWLRKETASIGGLPAWRNPRWWKQVGIVALIALLSLLLLRVLR